MPEDNNFDKEFYNLCKLDNHFIFTFTDSVKIPATSLDDLNSIINIMKLGKDCDFYQLTAEHLKFCGRQARLAIIDLINHIIDHIYFLTCPQANIGIGSALHNG